MEPRSNASTPQPEQQSNAQAQQPAVRGPRRFTLESPTFGLDGHIRNPRPVRTRSHRHGDGMGGA